MQKKTAASARSERRQGERRVSDDRRSRMRLKPDRRRGFGRRKEDLSKAATLEQSLSEALAEAEKFGPQDPRVAVALNNLGMFYYRANKDSRAEPLHKRALEIQEKTLGPTHPDMVQTLYNLAALYYAQGKYGDSETLLKRALDILQEARRTAAAG